MADSSHPDSAPAEETSSSDDLIRAVMVDQKRVVSRNALPELEPVPANGKATSKAAKRAKNLTAQDPTRRGLRGRITGYRPTRKHILLTALALVVFFRPWLIPGLLFVAFWVALVAYLTLGHDRMTELMLGARERFVRRYPKSAEKLRQRADRFALKFDAMLEKLPERWAEKLALPDMSQPSTADENLADRPDPFDRLKQPEVYRG